MRKRPANPMDKEKCFDECLNDLFKEIIIVLNKRVKYVRKKKRLHWPNKHYELLDGLLLYNEENSKDNIIYLDSIKNKNKMVKILIHECLHIIMPISREDVIKKHTQRCFDFFAVDQKNIIKSYLPKKEVKINP